LIQRRSDSHKLMLLNDVAPSADESNVRKTKTT